MAGLKKQDGTLERPYRLLMQKWCHLLGTELK